MWRWGEGSLSDNQMIGFSLPIIFDSMSLSPSLAFGVMMAMKRIENKHKKGNTEFPFLSFPIRSMKIICPFLYCYLFFWMSSPQVVFDLSFSQI